MVTNTKANPIFFEFMQGFDDTIDKLKLIDFMDITMININSTVTVEKKLLERYLPLTFAPDGVNCV
ncbi:hypothetical protein DZJ_19940 [Dickeya ananatis]